MTKHHLIRRDTKKLFSPDRYFASRYYWGNQVIICRKHHEELDGPNPVMGTIKKETIEECKRYFEDEKKD